MAFVVAVLVFAAGFYCRCLVPAVFEERFLPLGDYGSVVFRHCDFAFVRSSGIFHHVAFRISFDLFYIVYHSALGEIVAGEKGVTLW